MKHLRQLCLTVALIFTFALSTYAGGIECTGITTPAEPTGNIECAGLTIAVSVIESVLSLV